jgi:hypothetical protein
VLRTINVWPITARGLYSPPMNESRVAYNVETINQLVNTNWIRTLAWSARGLILAGLLAIVLMK